MMQNSEEIFDKELKKDKMEGLKDLKELDSDSDEEVDLHHLTSHEDDVLKIVMLKFNSTKVQSKAKPSSFFTQQIQV